jgi:hypothetical protein
MGNTCKSTKTEPTVGTIAQLSAPIEPRTSHEVVVEKSLTTEITQSADGLITQKKQEEV